MIRFRDVEDIRTGWLQLRRCGRNYDFFLDLGISQSNIFKDLGINQLAVASFLRRTRYMLDTKLQNSIRNTNKQSSLNHTFLPPLVLLICEILLYQANTLQNLAHVCLLNQLAVLSDL